MIQGHSKVMNTWAVMINGCVIDYWPDPAHSVRRRGHKLPAGIEMHDIEKYLPVKLLELPVPWYHYTAILQLNNLWKIARFNDCVTVIIVDFNLFQNENADKQIYPTEK